MYFELGHIPLACFTRACKNEIGQSRGRIKMICASLNSKRSAVVGLSISEAAVRLGYF